MAYLNPQLQQRTVNMILQLKEWIVTTSYKTIVKERYGQDICDCVDRRIYVATNYVEYMQCYTFPTDDNEDPYNCLSEAELITVIEKSKAITISKC